VKAPLFEANWLIGGRLGQASQRVYRILHQ
jgi:hypothetical protein